MAETNSNTATTANEEKEAEVVGTTTTPAQAGRRTSRLTQLVPTPVSPRKSARNVGKPVVSLNERVLKPEGEEQTKAAGFFIHNAPHLTALKVIAPFDYKASLWHRIGDQPSTQLDYDIFGGSFASGSEPAKLKLPRMNLEQVILEPKSATPVQNHIDLSELKCLQLIKRLGIENLMTVLAPVCNLTELHITMAWHDESEQQSWYGLRGAAEALLNSFSGLEVLWLDFRDKQLMDVSCIIHYGPSLRQLGLGSAFAMTENWYSATDLARLLQSALQLEDLATNICRVDLGIASKVTQSFKLTSIPREANEEATLEVCLTPISAHRTLKHFRIVNLPIVRYGKWPHRSTGNAHESPRDSVEVARTVMQHYDTQILSYMSNLGSKVQLLGLAGEEIVPMSARGDGNAHMWPRYYYTKERVADGAYEDSIPKERVVAVPTRIGPGRLVNTVFSQMFDINRGLRGA
ncbi:hypothetical protein G6011_00085 [Alternaria panax]|uniref:Uncharacterized protein n=1 Tax=Alternaria panax TaxID=48097 RepID=A0AAD4NVE9_9PLEO|nr:hypothetical protein G6011_00085 [Alternaria panax]